MKKIIIITVLSILFSGTAFALEFGEVDIHGFISQGGLKSDDHEYNAADTNDGTFEFNEFGINFSTDLNDELRLGMQLLARDLGEIGNDKVEIDWAYADYRYRNWLGLRVGKVKKPIGLYNASRDVDAARTAIFLPQCIYPDAQREAVLASKGVAIYGTLPGHVDYEFVHGVFDVPKDAGIAYLLRSYGTITDTKVDNSAAGALTWNTPLDGLRTGISGTEYNVLLNMLSPLLGAYTLELGGEYYILSLEYTYNDFMICGEYQGSKLTTHRIIPAIGLDTDTRTDVEKYYVMSSYRFTDWFELGMYYAVYYPDKDDKDGDNLPADGDFKEEAWLKDFALSLRFDINFHWILKLEGHKMDGLADVDYSDSDDPADPDPDWYMFAAKLSYSF